MSIDSCTAFLEQTQCEPDLRRLLRATTDTRELIVLGRSTATRSLSRTSGPRRPPSPTGTPRHPPDAVAGTAGTTICHYEFDLHNLPELRPILAELPNLTIKPPTVDLDLFRASFRRDDLEWAWISPVAPEFQRRYQEVMAPYWTQGESEIARRDFHLVNLDQHVDHPRYEQYFDAKARTIAHLEWAFGSEIQFSGSMWYPPFAYRLWHANATQPGWRMYLIDFDEEISPSDTRSFFRYLHPHTKEIVTLRDRPGMLCLFKMEQHKDRLSWHCIVNGADRNRWSFGFVVPDDWMSRLPCCPQRVTWPEC